MTALEVRIKRMSYKSKPTNQQSLIQDLIFNVEAKQFASILGPSGCGKTTLLRIIAGLEKNYDGEVRLDGIVVERPSRAIQIVFQDGRLLPWKSVYSNLAFASPSNKSDEVHLRVMEILSRVGLADRLDSWPATLSGGEETRIALARALLWIPKLLLLDEPFRNLDIVTRNVVQKLLHDLISQDKETPAVLQVSHSIEDAVFLSDIVYCLAARPMRITRTFCIDVPRPRMRSDNRLQKLQDEILAHLME